jgi:hypothetical protein
MDSSKLAQKLVQSCPVIDDFSYPYCRLLLDAIIKLRSNDELFSSKKANCDHDRDRFYFTASGSLLFLKILNQIPKNNNYIADLRDSDANREDVDAYIKTASEFLAIFE